MTFALLALLWTAPQADERLDKPVGIAEYSVPAPKVCADLQALTGVPMSCDRDLSEDLIVLVVRHRPAREILDKIATTFGWEWRPRDGGYRLTPTDAFTRTAATGRSEILAAEGARRQRAAQEYASRIQNQSRADIANELDQATARWDAAAPNAKAAWAERVATLRQQLDPWATVALAAFSDLNPHRVTVLADDRLVLSTDPGPLERPLSTGAKTAAATTAAHLGIAVRTTDDGQTAVLSSPSAGAGGREDQSDSGSAVVQLDSWMQATVYLLAADGQVMTQSKIALPPPKPLELPRLPGYVASALLEATSDDENLSPPTNPGAALDPLNKFAEWIAAAAITMGSDVISDAYDAYRDLGGSDKISEAVLDQARQDGFSPVAENGWLVNRNERWAQYREEQTPRNVLWSLGSPIELLPLDDRAFFASQLTVAQLQSPETPITRSEYWFYRFWKSLTRDLKAQLLGGRAALLKDLPSSVVGFLYEAGESPDVGDAPTYATTFGGDVPSLFTEPEFVDYRAILAQLRPDPSAPPTPKPESPYAADLNDFAALSPARIDPSATLSVQTVVVPGLFDPQTGRLYAPGELTTEDMFELGTPLKVTTLRAYRFHFQLRKGVEVRFDVAEATVGTDVKGDRRTWPSDLRDRVRQHRALENAYHASQRDIDP